MILQEIPCEEKNQEVLRQRQGRDQGAVACYFFFNFCTVIYPRTICTWYKKWSYKSGGPKQGYTIVKCQVKGISRNLLDLQ